LYWFGALIMLPWIVDVFQDESPHVVDYHIPILRFGITFFLVAGLATTALTLRRPTPLPVLTGTATATTALVAAWFAVAPAPASRITATLLYALLVLVPTALLSLAAVLSRLSTHPPSRHLTTALYTAAALLAPLAVFAAIHAHPVQTDIRQRLLWTSLDLAEFASLLVIAAALRYRSRYLPVIAVASGTLFLCDAWYDVVGHAGTFELYAALMLVLELPLAGLCLWVGYTSAHSAAPAATTRKSR
jgi:hypothetical protein